MSKDYLSKRPRCEDKTQREPCKNPAMFIKTAPVGTWLVCGNCARKYITSALNPFRMKEYQKG
jgi:hypothetical protein